MIPRSKIIKLIYAMKLHKVHHSHPPPKHSPIDPFQAYAQEGILSLPSINQQASNSILTLNRIPRE